MLSNQKEVNLDIIVPCFNPKPDWEKQLINRIDEFQRSLDTVFIRIILVNDGSSVSMSTEVESLKNYYQDRFEYHNYEINKGKG